MRQYGRGKTVDAEQQPWKSLLEEASAYHYGVGDVLEDHSEALRLYKQAARLGAIEAFLPLGQIYNMGEDAFRDPKQALEWFKEVAGRGDASCNAEMARFYEEREHWDNCMKCWDQFFAVAPANRLEARERFTGDEIVRLHPELSYHADGSANSRSRFDQ
jgi:TPR repeat protein